MRIVLILSMLAGLAVGFLKGDAFYSILVGIAQKHEEIRRDISPEIYGETQDMHGIVTAVDEARRIIYVEGPYLASLNTLKQIPFFIPDDGSLTFYKGEEAVREGKKYFWTIQENRTQSLPSSGTKVQVLYYPHYPLSSGARLATALTVWEEVGRKPSRTDDTNAYYGFKTMQFWKRGEIESIENTALVIRSLEKHTLGKTERIEFLLSVDTKIGTVELLRNSDGTITGQEYVPSARQEMRPGDGVYVLYEKSTVKEALQAVEVLHEQR